MGNIGTSEYTFKYLFTGGGGYAVGYLYPDDTEWTAPNQYGARTPRTSIWRCEKDHRSTGAPWKKTFAGKDDKTYTISVTYGGGRLPMTWVECASMTISAIHSDPTADPNTPGYITVDIMNTGGDGEYELVLMDGVVEVDRSPIMLITAGMFGRETLEFLMLNRDMTFTVQLIDKRDDTVVDSRGQTVTIYKPDPCEGVSCEPECVDTDLYDTVCDDGVCVRGVLLESNSSECGYVPPEPEPEPEPRKPPCEDYGDIDRDGYVTADDALYVARHSLAEDFYPMTPEQKIKADVDGDGKVTYSDAELISKYVDGTSDTFPICETLEPAPEPPLQPVIPGMPEPEEPKEPEPEPEPTNDTMMYIYVIIGIIIVFMMLRGS